MPRLISTVIVMMMMTMEVMPHWNPYMMAKRLDGIDPIAPGGVYRDSHIYIYICMFMYMYIVHRNREIDIYIYITCHPWVR